jgi:serine/threonine-protein kinase RsbW
METVSEAGRLSMVLPAARDSVTQARREVGALAAAAGAGQQQVHAVCLAVSEALSNVVVHAYNREGGEIQLTAALVADELVVVVADDGCGLRAPSGSPGLGLGMRWMAQFSDDLTFVTRPSGGLEVRLVFKLACATSRTERPGDSAARVAAFC